MWFCLKIDRHCELTQLKKNWILALDKSRSDKLQENFRFKLRNERFQFNYHSQCKLRSLKRDLNFIAYAKWNFVSWKMRNQWNSMQTLHKTSFIHQKEIFKWCNLKTEQDLPIICQSTPFDKTEHSWPTCVQINSVESKKLLIRNDLLFYYH